MKGENFMKVGAEQKIYKNQQLGAAGQGARNVQMEVFGFATNGKMTTTKKFNANELNFEGFKKKNRAAAFDFANRSLNEVNDLAGGYNKDFPSHPYFPKYEEFPVPENFNPKNLGGKDEAYHAWKTSVTEWVENAKQDIERLKSSGLETLVHGLQKQVYEGFIQVYAMQGLEIAQINAVCQELKGDARAIKARLDKAVKEINGNTTHVVREEGNATRYQEALNTVDVHHHIDHAMNANSNEHRHTRDTVINEAIETRNTVHNESVDTRNEIRNLAEQIINNTNTNKEEIKGILNEILTELDKKPDKARSILQFLKDLLTKGILGITIETLQKAKEILQGGE